jgi:hypothetical protein
MGETSSGVTALHDGCAMTPDHARRDLRRQAPALALRHAQIIGICRGFWPAGGAPASVLRAPVAFAQSLHDYCAWIQ